MSEQHKCCGTAYHGQWNPASPCGKNAKFERDGKHYCGTHDPVAVESKRVARSAKFDAEYKATRDRQDAAKAKQQELERNAARYLWLRDRDWFDNDVMKKHGIKYGYPETVDTAVDAVMKSEEL